MRLKGLEHRVFAVFIRLYWQVASYHYNSCASQEWSDAIQYISSTTLEDMGW